MSDWRWTDQEWQSVCSVFEHGFKSARDDPWSPEKAMAWRVVLDDLAPELVEQAVARLINGGQIFLPSLGELIVAARHDPDWPTWPDAQAILYGRHGVLLARPPRTGNVTESSPQLIDQAILEAAFLQHPAIAAFVAAIGPRRLRMLGVEDPDWGQKRLDDLGVLWAEHDQRARARAANGLPVALPAASAARGLLGAGNPRQLDAGQLVAGLNGEREHGDQLATNS